MKRDLRGGGRLYHGPDERDDADDTVTSAKTGRVDSRSLRNHVHKPNLRPLAWVHDVHEKQNKNLYLRDLNFLNFLKTHSCKLCVILQHCSDTTVVILRSRVLWVRAGFLHLRVVYKIGQFLYATNSLLVLAMAMSVLLR